MILIGKSEFDIKTYKTIFSELDSEKYLFFNSCTLTFDRETFQLRIRVALVREKYPA